MYSIHGDKSDQWHATADTNSDSMRSMPINSKTDVPPKTQPQKVANDTMTSGVGMREIPDTRHSPETTGPVDDAICHGQ